MGGVVAARVVALGLARVDGLVLSSPAFDPGLNYFQKMMLAVLPSVAPNLRVHNGVHPEWISHDRRVVRAYQQDRLVHHRISGRLARFIVEGGTATLKQAATWHVPTLLLYAGQDRLVNPQGSQAFAQAAPAKVVTSHRFDGHYHEIFNELDREPVYARLQEWLQRWF